MKTKIDAARLRELWVKPVTLQTIGDEFGVSRERVRQVGAALGLPARPRGPARAYERKAARRASFTCAVCGKETQRTPARAAVMRWCSRQCAALGRRKYDIPEAIRAIPDRKARAAAITKWRYHNVVKKTPALLALSRERNRAYNATGAKERWRARKLKEDPDYFKRQYAKRRDRGDYLRSRLTAEQQEAARTRDREAYAKRREKQVKAAGLTYQRGVYLPKKKPLLSK